MTTDVISLILKVVYIAKSSKFGFLYENHMNIVWRSEMELNQQQEKWASKRRQGVAKTLLRSLLIQQECKCALSGVEMIFDTSEGTPVTGGKGCHPLYPAVDHIDPGNPDGGHQIVCYALNDLKGHLPFDCFYALTQTNEWRSLMDRWRKQAAIDREDRVAFKRLLRPNAKLKKS